MTILSGKKGLIMGVANNKSIAWGIAEEAKKYGAELAFTYQGETLLKRIEPLAKSIGSDIVIPCDITDLASVKKTFEIIEQKWGKLDFIVHAIAYSDKEELRGKYLDTSLPNFLNTMNISAYSLVLVAKEGEKLLKNAGGGSIITLSYYGAEKVIPHYNVMGVAKAALEASVRYLAMDMGKDNIRVNAISAGPVKTLAASGIGDFRLIFKWNEYNAPLRKNVTLEDVGGAGVFLLSSLGGGVTGETLHVDAGYHIVGMKAPDAPDISIIRDEE
jgi:enoyl-[acyl-carrier protein] reductase I